MKKENVSRRSWLQQRNAKDHCLWSRSRKTRPSVTARPRAERISWNGRESAQSRWSSARRQTRIRKNRIISKSRSSATGPTLGSVWSPIARWTAASMSVAQMSAEWDRLCSRAKAISPRATRKALLSANNRWSETDKLLIKPYRTAGSAQKETDTCGCCRKSRANVSET